MFGRRVVGRGVHSCIISGGGVSVTEELWMNWASKGTLFYQFDLKLNFYFGTFRQRTYRTGLAHHRLQTAGCQGGEAWGQVCGMPGQRYDWS